MNGSDGWSGRGMELMDVVMMRCWMESPRTVATNKRYPGVATLRRISLVSLLPHGLE